ncbi:MAG: hypothetical protein ABSA93_06530 [Streptosporangiaceae bacterium]
MSGVSSQPVEEDQDMNEESSTPGSSMLSTGGLSRRTTLRLGAATAGGVMVPFAVPGIARAATARRASAVTLPPASGGDDAAALNAVLAAHPGAVIRGYPGASYVVHSSLIVGSGTTLDMTGCTITLNTYVLDTIVRNQSATPTRAATDVVTTAGSDVITSATARFTREDVGKWVCIGLTLAVGAGFNATTGLALAGGPAIAGTVPGGNVLTARIIRVVNATTAVLSNRADLAKTAQPMNIFDTRDRDITVRGGTWVRDTGRSLMASDGGASIKIHHLVFRNIDSITIEDLSVVYPIAGTGKYGISVGMATKMTVQNIVFNTTSDGVHLQGPISSGLITNITGTPGDDFVSLTAADWPNFQDCTGDLTDITITNVSPTNGPVSVVKLMGDKNTTVRDIFVRNVGGSTTGSGNGAVWIGDDSILQGATFYNIAVDTVTTQIIPAEYFVKINGTGVKEVDLRNLTRDAPDSSKETVLIQTQNIATPMTARRISLSGVTFTAGNVPCIGVGSDTNVATLILDDFTVLGGAANGGTNGTLPMVQVSGAVDTLNLSNGTFSGSGDYLVRLNSATSATVSRLSIDQVDVSGFGSGGVVAANPDTGQTHTFPEVLMTGCTINDMAWICDIGAETGGSTVTTEFELSTVTTTNMNGNAYIRDTGVVTFELYKVQLSGSNWDVLPGGQLTVIQLSTPPAGIR